MKQSVLIIGAGLGGLFTGAMLAHEGLHVTILEKNATIGGGLQSFRRFGEVFDTGMHLFGGMQKGGNMRRICEYLGIFDESLFSFVNDGKTDTIYVAEDNTTYHISYGRQPFIDSLAAYFPDQRDNITRYVDAMYRLTEEVPMYYLRPASPDLQIHSDDFFLPADAFIAKYITDARLRSIVAYLTPLYSGCAGITPAFVHSIVSTLIINGPCRFVGGSELFANKLRDKIESCGGKVYTSEGAVTINTAHRTITSVTSAKGNTYTADHYISDIHPATLLSLIDDPKALPKAYRTRLSELPNAYSAFTLNIKFKAGTFPYLDHNAFYMEHYDDIWHLADDDICHPGDANALWPSGFMYMTPPEPNQPAHTNKMIITIPMPWSAVKPWEHTTLGHRPADYQAWKQQCAEAVIQRMETMNPGFRQCIEAVNTASPLTIRDYYAVKDGSMCGYIKDCNNITHSHITVVTKIPNLLLTGQCVNLHGFCGVTLTAINTSEAILGRNHILNKLNNEQ